MCLLAALACPSIQKAYLPMQKAYILSKTATPYPPRRVAAAVLRPTDRASCPRDLASKAALSALTRVLALAGQPAVAVNLFGCCPWAVVRRSPLRDEHDARGY